MKVYYLNKERFEQGDTLKAAEYAIQRAKEDPNIDTITFLVYQQNHYPAFLGEMNFTQEQYKQHGYTMPSGRKIQIHTVKTYHPEYMFAGHGQKEILISVGVPPKDLEQFEDKSNIKIWIIVPWTMSENEEFLRIHEAIDMETNESIVGNFVVDQRVVNAIEWLKETSYPNEGYHHLNDVERLHQMANALSYYKIPLEYATIVFVCMQSGFIPSAARSTAEAFVKAQNRKFAVKGKNNYSFYKKIIEGK